MCVRCITVNYKLTYSKADQICAATGRIILPIINLCIGKHNYTYNSQVASFLGSPAPEHKHGNRECGERLVLGDLLNGGKILHTHQVLNV